MKIPNWFIAFMAIGFALAVINAGVDGALAVFRVVGYYGAGVVIGVWGYQRYGSSGN